MRYKRIISWLVLVGLLVTACAQSGATPQPAIPTQTTPTSQLPTTGDHPEAVLKARQALAEQLGIDPEDIEIHLAEAANWPNACLGIPTEDEMCAEVIVNGYGGILIANQLQYEFRTDSTGDSVRFLPAATLNARQVLAQQLHLTLEDVAILSFERVEWPDACLGVEVEDRLCAQVVTPGYRVMLRAQERRYEFYTDETGGTVLLVEAPEPHIPDVAILWQQADGNCETAQIGSQAVAFGPCNGALMIGQYASEERRAAFESFVSTYAPFEAVTPAGEVNFQGEGSREATPAEQRMITEWARLVFVEAVGGRSGASYGLALAWHREGGIAGFCDDLTVFVTGEASSASCGGGQPTELARSRLSPDQLTQLFAWIDGLQAFDIDRTDAAKADAMTIRLVFSGAGRREATEAEKQAILDFAAQLYAQLEQHGEPSSDLEQAQQALQNYFLALKQGDYARALEFYGGDFEVLSGYNPDIPEEDQLALMEAGCRYNGLVCSLLVMEILEEEQISPTEYQFTVRFANPDGSLFEQGPCCGEDPTASPPVSEFKYTVVKSGDRFLVQELPVYVP